MATKVGGGGSHKPCPKCKMRHCICKITDRTWNEDQEEKEKCPDCGLVYCICKEGNNAEHGSDDL